MLKFTILGQNVTKGQALSQPIYKQIGRKFNNGKQLDPVAIFAYLAYMLAPTNVNKHPRTASMHMARVIKKAKHHLA